MTTHTRRDLRPFPLKRVVPMLSGKHGGCVVITMSIGQWDPILSSAYDNGFILLELDDDEWPVRAYCKDEQTPRL